tara:strand:+ start:7105 stop:8592 length:1488 start_codon:yes stop_codon:yes gene_type:complete
MDRIVNESINELRRQFLDQSQVLSTVTELIGEGLQISEESQLLKRAATKLIESHDFEHCCIFIGRQTAQVRADESMQLAVAVSLESLLDPHLIPTVDLTWIASCEQAAKTAAARGNGRVEAHIEESSTDSGTCYAITLQYQGDCMGVIVAVTQKTDASYLRLLSVYASILSSLLLNARQGYRMSRSITEQTKELDAANERAESSDKVKSQFVSNMSHEIKTPMNAIVGLTSLLVDSELANEQKECVNTILTTCDSLLEIIDNVLDFSKIGSGQLQIAQEPLQLRKMADELIQKYAVQARNKGIELQLLLAPEVPHRVVTDPVRLKQVLANLIENGIKFTDTGMVRLDIYCENLSQTEASVRFEVTDTGIGIDDAQMAEIYDDFNQLDNSDTRRHGGTGIGLCIARKLVELLGGEFKSSSIRTAGSRFWFVLILPVRQWQQDNSSQESTDQPDAQAERISPATVRESSAREPSAHEPSKHQTSLSSSRSAQGGRVD